MSSWFDEISEVSAQKISALSSSKETKKLKSEQQLFDEWLESKRGIISASNFHKLISMPKAKAAREAGELGETAKTYVLEVVAQSLGAPNKDLNIFQFRWGKKYEPIAVEHYEKINGVEIQNKGSRQKLLMLNKDVGGTPDGLIGLDGGTEFKCPEKAENHLKALLINTPEELKKMNPLAYWQSVGALLITGRKWWDFSSYYPFFEERLKLKSIRINRKDCEEDLLFLQGRLTKALAYKKQVLSKISA